MWPTIEGIAILLFGGFYAFIAIFILLVVLRERRVNRKIQRHRKLASQYLHEQ